MGAVLGKILPDTNTTKSTTTRLYRRRRQHNSMMQRHHAMQTRSQTQAQANNVSR